MKIIIEDGETQTVFEDVSDYYLAVRQLEKLGLKEGLAGEFQTRSFSAGGCLREIAKEITQALLEIQDILKGQRNGNS